MIKATIQGGITACADDCVNITARSEDSQSIATVSSQIRVLSVKQKCQLTSNEHNMFAYMWWLVFEHAE